MSVETQLVSKKKFYFNNYNFQRIEKKRILHKHNIFPNLNFMKQHIFKIVFNCSDMFLFCSPEIYKIH